MSETVQTPSGSLPENQPQFKVKLIPLIHSQEGPEGKKVRVGEQELLESFNHTLEERDTYEKNFAGGVKQAEINAAKVTKIEVSTPKDEEEDHSQETDKGFPKKAIWHGPDGDQPVTVLKTWGEGGDNRIYYQIEESETGVPADELEFLADEPTDAETEKSKEFDENFKKECLNPKRIMELKQELKEKSEKEARKMRGAESLAQLRELDPNLAESIENKVRDELLFEYFETTDRGKVPEELRNDIAEMLKLSEWALENLMLKPDSGESTPNRTVIEADDVPEAAADEAEKSSEFTEGQKVNVLRTSGDMEDDWEVDSGDLIIIDGKKYITVSKTLEEVTLYKDVLEEDLKKWQSGDTAASAESTAEAPAVDPSETPPPAPEDDPATAKKKIKNRIQAFKVFVWGAPGAALGWLSGEKNKFEDDENLSEEEKKKKRRNRRLGGVAGILAAFGAGYLLCKVGHNVLDHDNGTKDGLAGIPGADGGDTGGMSGSELDSRLDSMDSKLKDLNQDHTNHQASMTEQHNNDMGNDQNGGENGESGAGEELGEEFNVEPGHGLSAELQDYSKEQGFGELSDDESYKIYEEARERFGVDLIDSIDKQADTYIRSQGDVGISNPGRAVWPTNVEEFFRQRLTA